MDHPFILVDSDILIDASRGITQAVRTLEIFDETHTFSVSVVTKLELMVGCENKQEFKELNSFLEHFECFASFRKYFQESSRIIPTILIKSWRLNCRYAYCFHCFNL